MKKLGVYFIVAMLIVSFALGSVSNNAYAETTKKIGIGNLTKDDLVAAWYCDEDSEAVVKDYMGNYDGTANGTAIVDTPYGKGRSFDGVDDYIEFDNPIIPTGEKSIKFKMRINELPTETYVAILDNSASNPSNDGIHIRITKDGVLDIYAFKKDRSEFLFRLGSYVNINEWIDVLLTWDGTINEDGVKLYINDMTTPISTCTATAKEKNIGTVNLTVGARKATIPDKFCNFTITQMKIYNKAYIPPSAPTNLIAEPGNRKVKLSWKPVEGFERYIVKRSETEGGEYDPIPEKITDLSYTDTGLENGKTYYYVVCAVKNGAESSNSNEASATPEGDSSSGSGDNALLRITMSNGKINEYDLSMSDVEDFIDWYEDRANDRGKPYYIMEKEYNIGPFESRKDYITFDKILQFEVMEYNK